MNKNNNIYGGRGKEIPLHIEPINSPYHTTSEKQIHVQKKSTFPEPYVKGGPSSYPEDEQTQKLKSYQSQIDYATQSKQIKSSQPAPLIDLQIYPDATKKPNPLADKQQAMMPLQPFALSSPFMPPQFQNYFNNFMKNFTTPFIYKDYHINLGGPNGDHATGTMIYEDALPPADIYSSYKTLRERNSLCNYVRGTFVTSDEGEFVDFKGTSKTSLNSRLKLIQLNPYNTNIYSSNPYKGLPNDQSFLIYKSCYPIVHDKQSGLVQCNKQSTGINIRAYKLNLKEFMIKYFNSKSKMEGLKFTKDIQMIFNEMQKKLGDKTKLEDLDPEFTPLKFDVWRDEIYYTWIRNKICQQNICPNFVSSYCYFINKEANISFAKNGMLLDELKDKSVSELLSKEFTNCIMLLLTESPNQNIYQWSSNTYTNERGIHKMVHSGFKPETHWKSVIAQMLIIFYTMNKYLFTIREMKIQNNFYVKDINIHGDPKQFWQYTISNIDYFVPNFGHLVMLDHDYKVLIEPENKNKFRIMMKDEFGDKENEIRSTILSNAIQCFTNVFGSNFTEDGGSLPPANIIEIFNEIHKELEEIKNKIKLGEINYDKIWDDILLKFMCKLDFIHNRVGTPLRDLEYPYVRKNDTRPRPFKIGELVIWEEKFETYKILLFVKNIDDKKSECVVKNLTTNLYETKEIPIDLLYHYSELDTIKQDGKLGEPVIGPEHILERYIL
jgi:hypothetical protein